MCRLFETIRIENRQLCSIDYHNRRFNRSRKELFGLPDFIDLFDVIEIPKELGRKIYKCRLIYDKEIISIDFEPYSPRVIKSLKLVVADRLSYQYKYHNRDSINKLLTLKGDCDDILIIKNGLITDASYANVVFYNGEKWVTPAKPLLKGIMREKLLAEGMIFEQKISLNEIKLFKNIKLINAMLPMELAPEILPDNLH